MTFWQTVWAAVIATAIYKASRWAWLRRRVPVDLSQKATKEVASGRRNLLIERAVALAQSRGDRLPVTLNNGRPAAIKFSDGTFRFYFPNASDDEMTDYFRRGGQPHLTSFAKPPRTVMRWTTQELKAYIKAGEIPDS